MVIRTSTMYFLKLLALMAVKKKIDPLRYELYNFTNFIDSMRWHRINALLIRHLYLFKRSVPRLMDILFWPVMELLLWGFISAYISKLNIAGFNAVTVLLGAVVFWDLLSQSQRAVSIAFLEEVWERNFLNIFVAPLRISEFLASTVILAFVRLLMVAVVMSILAFFLFHFNFFIFGFYLLPFMLNLLFFGSAIGLFTTAIILRYGTSAQVIAFGLLFLVQPFSAVFYPVSVLPQVVQWIAYLLPSTYVFEGMRAVIATGTLPSMLLVGAIVSNIIYFVVLCWYFYRSFAAVKVKGKLLKLD
ncbi:MAG TPA: ABC transporter permease [Candidatus Paceibacterota bacterium]